MPAPNPMKDAAEKKSGFYQCRTCGLHWFGRYNSEMCPEGPQHGKPIQVAMLCRECDGFIAIENLAEHLTTVKHERRTVTQNAVTK